jgi:hypothetical protein
MDMDEKTRAEWLEFYHASAKPAIGLRRVYPPEDRVGGSAFGGLPHLPMDVPWPANKTGKPLPFILELDLATLPRIPDLSLLPPAGGLYLFMEHDWDEGKSDAKMVWQPLELAKVPVRQPPPGWIHWIKMADEVKITSANVPNYAPVIAYEPREPIDPFVMTTHVGAPPNLPRPGIEYLKMSNAFWALTGGVDITKDEWVAAQVPPQMDAQLSDADRRAWPFDWLCIKDMTWRIRFSEKGKTRYKQTRLKAPEFEAACESWKQLAMARGLATEVAEGDRKCFWDWLREVENRFNRDLAVVDESIRKFHLRHIKALSDKGREVFRTEHQEEWRLLGHGTRLPNFDTERHLAKGEVLLFACNPRSDGDFPPPIEIWIDRADLEARRFDRLVVDKHFS